jgi:amidase
VERDAAILAHENGELTMRLAEAEPLPAPAPPKSAAKDDDLAYLQLVELAQSLRQRALSPVEATKAMLERIARLDPGLHSYLAVTEDLALAQAKKAEAEIQSGLYRGPLHGVPIALKDLYFTKDIPTTFGMKVYQGWTPDYDATVVTRLYEAGAVMLGKLHLHEGAFAEHHPELPAPLNPWDKAYWPGGSSSGSGVAVAAGLCYGTLGSDTGGSIRFPCNACGLTGVKTTWGRVSRHGAFPLSESLDTVGPMNRSAADAAVMLRAIAGADESDPTTSLAPVPDYLADLYGIYGARGLRIGVDRAYVETGVDSEIVAALNAALAVLEGIGAEIVAIKMPPIAAVMDGQLAFCGVESAAFHEPAFHASPEKFGPALSANIESGLAMNGLRYGGYQLERDKFKGLMRRAFADFDVLIAPILPVIGVRYDSYDKFLADISGMLRFTAPFNMAGNPTVTLPCGFSSGGLPIGFQLIGPHLSEARLLRAAHAFQQATDWHLKHPELS